MNSRPPIVLFPAVYAFAFTLVHQRMHVAAMTVTAFVAAVTDHALLHFAALVMVGLIAVVLAHHTTEWREAINEVVKYRSK